MNERNVKIRTGLLTLLASGALLNCTFTAKAQGDAPPADAPVIFSFAPTVGSAGTTVNISGTNLLDATDVRFNSAVAAFSAATQTNLVAIVPTNTTTGPITIYTPRGKVSSTAMFTVTNTAPPAVTSFTPLTGRAGTSVQIRGANLSDVTSVQFNGAEASFSILADLVLAVVPTNATTGPISVRTPLGTDSTKDVFIVTAQAPPVVSGFSPTEGVVGASVEIAGANLTDLIAVRFNGVEASFRELAGTLVATVPPNASTGPISVTTTAGTSVTTNAFTVTRLAAPVVTGFSPTTGAAGTSVRIDGTSLTGVTSVRFNGVEASFLSFGGSFNATVPSNATSGPITVITAGGTNTTASAFTITVGPGPVITSFAPTSAEIGASVEIRGQFLRDVTSVKFNGVSAVFTNSLFRPLSALVPITATTGPITVVTANGSTTTADIFTVINLRGPVIDSLSPLSGAAGSVVNIRGTNLTGVTQVEFSGVAASFIEFTSERLLAIVPTNAPSGPVRVVTQFGAALSKDVFEVIGPAPPPQLALSIRATAQNRLELSWSADSANFVLQFSDSLQVAGPWSNLSTLSETIGERKVVTLDATANQRFFRLVRP